jgi:hypothetical protein
VNGHADLSPQRWEHLQPDPQMLACLDEADQVRPRQDLLGGSADAKSGWSGRFADACARMVAARLAEHASIRRLRLTVRPTAGTSEPPTVVVGGRTKKVDVIAASLGSGLQLGFSLKGGNFRDREGRQFDKNLTGRSYELSTEMREIHEYQPHAFMTCLYFLPLGATCDKANGSSFAHVVQYLRAHTGRLDRLSPGQMRLFDSAIIGLYVPGDVEDYHYASDRPGGPKHFFYADPFPRGIVRYFDVLQDPPKTGRPMLHTTMDLTQMVDACVSSYSGEGAGVSWAPAEPDQEGEPPTTLFDASAVTH